MKDLEEVWEPVPGLWPFNTQDNADLAISLLHMIFFKHGGSVLLSYRKCSQGTGTETLQMLPLFSAFLLSYYASLLLPVAWL